MDAAAALRRPWHGSTGPELPSGHRTQQDDRVFKAKDWWRARAPMSLNLSVLLAGWIVTTGRVAATSLTPAPFEQSGAAVLPSHAQKRSLGLSGSRNRLPYRWAIAGRPGGAASWAGDVPSARAGDGGGGREHAHGDLSKPAVAEGPARHIADLILAGGLLANRVVDARQLTGGGRGRSRGHRRRRRARASCTQLPRAPACPARKRRPPAPSVRVRRCRSSRQRDGRDP